MGKASRRAIRLAAASFAPAAAVFLAVGHAAGEHGHFAWEPAAVAGTGLATAVLAFYTARLAAATSDDVSATQKLAKNDQDRLEKEDQPWIVVDRVETVLDKAVRTASTEIVNTGRGPAIGVIWEPYFLDESGGLRVALSPPGVLAGFKNDMRGIAGILLPGERRPAGFSAWIRDGRPGRYRLRGWYTDRDQERIIVFGDKPVQGWQMWLVEHAGDDFWNLRDRTISQDLIEHR